MSTKNSIAVRKAQAKVLLAGGRRFNALLVPAAAADVDALILSGYADTITGAIARALREAAARIAENARTDHEAQNR
jgi:alpha-beta hydrolase superfamily lysophospholipase